MKKNYTYFICHKSNIGSKWVFIFKDEETIEKVFLNDNQITLTEKKENLFYNYINNNNLWHKIESE